MCRKLLVVYAVNVYRCYFFNCATGIENFHSCRFTMNDKIGHGSFLLPRRRTLRKLWRGEIGTLWQMQKGADLTLDQSYIRLFLNLLRAYVLFSQNSRIRSVIPLIFWLLISSFVWLWLQWPESCYHDVTC